MGGGAGPAAIRTARGGDGVTVKDREFPRARGGDGVTAKDREVPRARAGRGIADTHRSALPTRGGDGVTVEARGFPRARGRAMPRRSEGWKQLERETADLAELLAEWRQTAVETG